MLALLIRFWWAPVIAALLLALGAQQLRVSNAKSELAQYKLEQAQLTRAAEAAARQREQTLQQQATQIEEAKNEELRIVGDQLDTALASLRNRPNRPSSDVPKTSTTCKGSTGAGLFKSDAEFLARLAASADRTAKERDACYKAYEALRN